MFEKHQQIISKFCFYFSSNKEGKKFFFLRDVDTTAMCCIKNIHMCVDILFFYIIPVHEFQKNEKKIELRRVEEEMKRKKKK